MFCKGISIIMMPKFTKNSYTNESEIQWFLKNSFDSLKYFFILAEVAWNIANLSLRENEILINRPFYTCIGRKNAIIVQDEHGFKYRKYNPSTPGQRYESWKCSRINKGCKCSIKTVGDIITIQRFEHNHESTE